MIFGTDTGKDQPNGTYDPGAFEILNIEDPGFEAKAERNLREGRPCDAYVWCYSNDTNEAFFRSSIARAQAAGIHRVWLDFEEEGVAGNWRIELWFRICDELRVHAGYYGNDWRFDHARFRDRPFWYCGYPDPNDGAWRRGYGPIANRDVQVFQFSSSSGTLDRNIVWDADWWQDWSGRASTLLRDEEDDVQFVMSDEPGKKPAYRVWEHPTVGGPVKKLVDPQELQRLSSEAFLGLVKTNMGQPFRAAPGFLDSIPDLHDAVSGSHGAGVANQSRRFAFRPRRPFRGQPG